MRRKAWLISPNSSDRLKLSCLPARQSSAEKFFHSLTRSLGLLNCEVPASNQADVLLNFLRQMTAYLPRAFLHCRIELHRRAARKQRLYPYAPKFLSAKLARLLKTAAMAHEVLAVVRRFDSAHAKIFQTAQCANR